MTQSRNVSFCAHTILQPDIFIVADTLADQRFATNPLGSILPEASLEVTSKRTEQMRQAQALETKA